MSQYITTYTKVHFYPVTPDEEGINIEDIAHSLSLLCRANGHFPEFYSVAQHSLDCAKEARAQGYSNRLVLACLLHDSAEAYISDIPRPVKTDLPDINRIEFRLIAKIMKKFLGTDLSGDEWQQVSDVDDTLLYHEFKHYAGEEIIVPPLELKSEPDFRERPFKEVEQEFLDMFKMLY